MGDGRLDDDTCQSRPGHLLRPALQYGMLDLMLRQTAKSSTISLARLLALVSKKPGEDVELEGEDVGCEVNVEEAEDDLAGAVLVPVVHQPLHQTSPKALTTPAAVEPRHLYGTGNVQPAQAPEAIPNPGHLDLETRIRSVLC